MTTQTTDVDEIELHEAEHIRHHHAHMVAALDELARALHDADAASAPAARTALETFFAEKLLPHARSEETSIYAAAADLSEGRLLVEALVREHRLIQTMIALEEKGDLEDARVWGLAIAETFRGHQAKEDEVVVPLLLAAPGVSLVEAHRGR